MIGLEFCSTNDVARKMEIVKQGLPYFYTEEVATDCLALIQHLEAERDQYKRERDAAVEKLRGKCSECINEYPGISHLADTECDNCVFNDSDYVQAEDHWQWRGVQEVE